MLETAVRICEAKFGAMYLSEADAFRIVAILFRQGLKGAGFIEGPPLPIYARIMLARPRTLPTGFIAPCLSE
jgi:hypothetical protein